MQDDDDNDDPMILNNRTKNHTSERTIVPWTVIFVFVIVLLGLFLLLVVIVVVVVVFLLLVVGVGDHLSGEIIISCPPAKIEVFTTVGYPLSDSPTDMMNVLPKSGLGNWTREPIPINAVQLWH